MKTLLILFLTLACAAAQNPTAAVAPAPDIKEVTDPKDVIVIGEIHAGTIAEAMLRYPNLKAKLDAAASKIANEKEKALLKVKDTDAPRAKIKMDELVAAGVPISKATQDVVNGAIRATPAKGTPTPTPSPSPTPNDGL